MSHSILDSVRSIEDVAGAVLDLYMTLESESTLPVSYTGAKGLDLAQLSFSTLELFSEAINATISINNSVISPVSLTRSIQGLKSITVLDSEDDFI